MRGKVQVARTGQRGTNGDNLKENCRQSDTDSKRDGKSQNRPICRFPYLQKPARELFAVLLRVYHVNLGKSCRFL